MRLAFLTASFAPQAGGVERHARRVGAELVRLGHQVRVLTRSLPGVPDQDQVDGMTVLRLPRRLDPQQRRQAREFLAPSDLVHSHDAYPLLKWRRLLPRVPRFMTWHGYEGWPIPLEARLTRRLASLMVSGSICMGEFICRWYGHGCDLISYGAMDPPAQVTAPPASGPVLLLGRLEPDTGALAAITALGLLREHHGQSLPLVVCGDGSLRSQAETAAREQGLAASFLGLVDNVGEHLAAARWVLCTGYLGILEALAHGRLVFATYDNPLKRDYLALHPCAGRGLVVAATPLALSGRMADYAAHPEREQAELAWAEPYARAQTWEALARLYLDLYRAKEVKP